MYDRNRLYLRVFTDSGVFLLVHIIATKKVRFELSDSAPFGK
jgi:hypothetical protein